MHEKKHVGALDQIREALNRALPEEVEDLKVVHLPNGAMHIEVTLGAHPEEENKWTRFAEEMHRESPLRGRSEEVNARVREFRDSFSFDGEE